MKAHGRWVLRAELLWLSFKTPITEATSLAQPASLTYSYNDQPPFPIHLYHPFLRGQDPPFSGSAPTRRRLTLNYFTFRGECGQSQRSDKTEKKRRRAIRDPFLGGDKNGSKSRYAIASRNPTQRIARTTHCTRPSERLHSSAPCLAFFSTASTQFFLHYALTYLHPPAP